MRADRLVSLVLLLQSRGQLPARALAAELEVSVRTVYRDLAALSASGVPVVAEAGPGGGCRLLEGYRFPLRGLSVDETEALLMLGVPAAVAELGLADALATAQRKIRVTGGADGAGPALVHLDMPRWFHGKEDVPHLRTLAEAVRNRRQLRLRYRRGASGAETIRAWSTPLLGVWRNKARDLASRGVRGSDGGAGRRGCGCVPRGTGRVRVPIAFAVSIGRRVSDLAAFWARWSASFVASRPKVSVRIRASPTAIAAFPEVFGDVGKHVVAMAVPDEDGCREVTLTFEHEAAAVHRLAGFGGQVEVLSPVEVRARMVATARELLDRYSVEAAGGAPV